VERLDRDDGVEGALGLELSSKRMLKSSTSGTFRRARAAMLALGSTAVS
jgi:hypothetical protein